LKPAVDIATYALVGWPEVAGTSRSEIQVGRRKPVIQGGPAGEIL